MKQRSGKRTRGLVECPPAGERTAAWAVTQLILSFTDPSLASCWPYIERLVAEAVVPARILPPPEGGAGLRALFRLQVTAASTLGAMAVSCGAILIDHGWLKLLGAGQDALAGLAEANGLGEPGPDSAPPGHLVVAYDLLRGTLPP